ncbi:hypothetical protein, partial [Azospirillum brasilense]|uniref:hypothetical protein n=1 Tax=Azospirillum brasilense TaxID=192 RepID=UPI001B3BEABB
MTLTGMMLIGAESHRGRNGEILSLRHSGRCPRATLCSTRVLAHDERSTHVKHDRCGTCVQAPGPEQRRIETSA